MRYVTFIQIVIFAASIVLDPLMSWPHLYLCFLPVSPKLDKNRKEKNKYGKIFIIILIKANFF